MNSEITNLDNHFLDSVSSLLTESRKKVKTAKLIYGIYIF